MPYLAGKGADQDDVAQDAVVSMGEDPIGKAVCSPTSVLEGETDEDLDM